MILVDTSVWIDHLRSEEPALKSALQAYSVLIHPFVIGEIACGGLKNRDAVLELLQGLRMAPVAADAEALRLIETRGLMARGVGYVDVHLLASVALAGDARLWTRDRRLAAIATEMSVAFKEPF